MRAKTIRGQSAGEIQEALSAAMADGFRPTLATVFLSVGQDRFRVCQALADQGIAVFGATTGGEFIDGDLASGSIAILLMDLSPSRFSILLEDYAGRDAGDVAAAMTRTALETFSHPGIILSYGFHVDTGLGLAAQIIGTINSVGGPDLPVWGGGAGDDFAYRETWVFNGERASDQGILMLVLDTDHVMLRGRSTTGMQAVGTEKRVTRAKDNWVYTIDDQPAAEMALRYLGISMSPEELETLSPGVIVLSVSRQHGDPVMRSSALFNLREGAIAVASGIREGDRIKLTLPPDFDSIDEAARQAQRVKDEEMPEADALLVFSCVGRLGAFGPMTDVEIKGIRDVYHVPMAGFFSYGEFGRANDGINELHNMTCCWVALKEKENT